MYRENLSFSDVDGVLNIERTYPDGKVEVISKAIETKDGTNIKKSMTSFDGTKTEYLYNSKPNGDYNQNYQIIDNQGNILLDDAKTFKTESDGTIISTHNDKKYKTTYNAYEISIFDYQTGQTVTIDVDSMLSENKDILLYLILIKLWKIYKMMIFCLKILH